MRSERKQGYFIGLCRPLKRFDLILSKKEYVLKIEPIGVQCVGCGVSKKEQNQG